MFVPLEILILSVINVIVGKITWSFVIFCEFRGLCLEKFYILWTPKNRFLWFENFNAHEIFKEHRFAKVFVDKFFLFGSFAKVSAFKVCVYKKRTKQTSLSEVRFSGNISEKSNQILVYI